MQYIMKYLEEVSDLDYGFSNRISKTIRQYKQIFNDNLRFSKKENAVLLKFMRIQ